MGRYIALLRGINVGGHKKVKMADLRAMVESLGFTDVASVLASGNVAFDADEMSTETLRATLQREIETTFGFAVDVIVVPRAQIAQLVERDPFDGVALEDGARLYVTFLSESPHDALDVAALRAAHGITIAHVTDSAVCCALSPAMKTPDLMKLFASMFDSTITTRNWNTVRKLAAL